MTGGLRSWYASALRVRRLVLAALAAAFFWPLGGSGAHAAEDPSEASTSQAARQDAIQNIPLAKVDPRFRQLVSDVLNDPSIFRRLPTNVVDCQPEMFTYLAQNPEVLTEIWRQLGVSKVELVRTGENSYDLRDNAGTTGKLFIVEQSCDASAQNRIVMYAEGAYDGKPFSKTVQARCVFLLRSGSVRETNGRMYVAARLDSFVKLDRPTVELMAQVAHPFVGKTADRNFADTLAFISNLSYTSEERPETIARLSGELEHVAAEQRAQLAAVARRCADARATLEASRANSASAPTIQR